VYLLVLVAELGFLSWRYATDAPAPSEPLGYALGWGAIISMVVMLVYSVARRVRALRQVARLSTWLHFHIFLGIQGFMFAVFHSLPMFLEGAINPFNPGALSFLGATVVFSSGVFGRFLFGRLPRGPDGEPIKSQRVFALWIILHRPLAGAMYTVTVVHILLSYMFTPSLGS
jgi:hypothetical protein